MSVFNPSVSVVTCPQQCSNGGECFRYDGGPYGIYGCDCQDDYVGMFCDYRNCEFVATVNCNTETLVSLTQAMHCLCSFAGEGRCLNGGTCSNDYGYCLCPLGYSGQFCEIGESGVALQIVMDIQ